MQARTKQQETGAGVKKRGLDQARAHSVRCRESRADIRNLLDLSVTSCCDERLLEFHLLRFAEDCCPSGLERSMN
jgi:hypothetical protein